MINVRCSICKKPLPSGASTQTPEFPFCSARCKLIDLGRWLNQEYAIRSEEEDDPALADDECCIP